MRKTAFCLFESSGVFKNLLEEKGFKVIAVDEKLGINILDFNYMKYKNVQIIIAHPPCTEFAVSGATHWERKKQECPERLELAIKLVKRTLEIIRYHKPRIWFIENPVGRIEQCVPALKDFFRWSFDPYQYAGYSSTPNLEAYTKKTILWGKYQIAPFKPIQYLTPPKGIHCMDWCMQKNGISLGNNEKKSEVRSKTPLGFATAFVEYNYEKKFDKQMLLF